MSQSARTPKYQLLPPLALDDLDRLKASIAARGVKVPVVLDEEGNVLDGHNRVTIAESLGIDYPRVVEAGLDEHEKRIFVAELNAARRQLTDAQKVLLGKRIEPDIAARAMKRQAHGTTAPGKRSVTSVAHRSEPKRTTDEVARAVQLGSGRTYERGKAVVEELEAEPDGPTLLRHLESGDWQLDDARQELRTRRKNEAEKRARDEQATSDRFMRIVGDPEGRIANARLLREFTGIRAAVRTRMLPLKTAAVAAALDDGEARATRRFIRDCRKWLDELEAEVSQGIRLLEREDVS